MRLKRLNEIHCLLSSITCIQYSAHLYFTMIFGKLYFLFFKNNFTRINHCKFTNHKSYLKPFLGYLPCILHREHFSIIFNVKKCALYSIKYGTINFCLLLVHSLSQAGITIT
jgi:hypothetical protein